MAARTALPIVALYNGWRKDIKDPEMIPDTSDEILSDKNFTLPANPYEVFGVSAADSLITNQTLNGFKKIQHSKQNSLISKVFSEHSDGQFMSRIRDWRDSKSHKSSQTDPVIIKPVHSGHSVADKFTSTSEDCKKLHQAAVANKGDSPPPKPSRMCKTKMLFLKKHESFSHKFEPNVNSDLLHDDVYGGSYKPKKHECLDSFRCYNDNDYVAAAPTPTEKEIERR